MCGGKARWTGADNCNVLALRLLDGAVQATPQQRRHLIGPSRNGRNMRP